MSRKFNYLKVRFLLISSTVVRIVRKRVLSSLPSPLCEHIIIYTLEESLHTKKSMQCRLLSQLATSWALQRVNRQTNL